MNIVMRSKFFVVEGNLAVHKILIYEYPWIYSLMSRTFFYKKISIKIYILATENVYQYRIKLWCVLGYYITKMVIYY